MMWLRRHDLMLAYITALVTALLAKALGLI